MNSTSDYYKQLANTVQGETLVTFLTKRFQRVGRTTAEKFVKFAGFKSEKRLGNMTNQELVYKITDLSSFAPILIPLKNSTDITVDAIDIEGVNWSDGDPAGKEYRVSIITSRGNFFDTVARAYNT